MLSVLIVANINYFKQTVSNNTHKERRTKLGTQKIEYFFFSIFLNNLMTTKHETSNYSHYSHVTMQSAPYKLKLYKSLSYD